MLIYKIDHMHLACSCLSYKLCSNLVSSYTWGFCSTRILGNKVYCFFFWVYRLKAIVNFFFGMTGI